MKLLIIRHGDPDYVNDTLTEKGRKEAELLSERIAPMDIKDYYVSPLGRARDTASYTLKKAGREAVTHDWLREFNVPIKLPSGEEKNIPWDMLPEYWTTVPEYYDKDKWYSTPVMKEAGMEARLRPVWDGLDGLLAEHGYVREGMIYRPVKPNEDTLAFFCHFGVGCVMLGHLLGISPVLLWHGFVAAPTSVTTITTEERREGTAYFRVSAYGDISHLYVKGEEPAFSGRFCEMFSNTEQRHD